MFTQDNESKEVVRHRPPTWLMHSKARAYYCRLAKSLPSLNTRQKDLLAMLSQSWQQYQAAAQELQDFAETNGTLSTSGSKGQIIPHPAFGLQKQALDSYCKLASALANSLKQEQSIANEDNAIQGLLNEANNLGV